VKALVCHTRLGPTAVFIPPAKGRPPASAAVPGGEQFTRPAIAQVGARGHQATWEDHCHLLEQSPPYAGRWTTEEVPDGLSAQQALSRVRRDAAMRELMPSRQAALSFLLRLLEHG
jgi:hypothetical protein